jgi:hypothetical protein
LPVLHDQCQGAHRAVLHSLTNPLIAGLHRTFEYDEAGVVHIEDLGNREGARARSDAKTAVRLDDPGGTHAEKLTAAMKCCHAR